MRGYRYRNRRILKIAQCLDDHAVPTYHDAHTGIWFGWVCAIQTYSCGCEPKAASATASFSVQPAFVTNICAILTIQKVNYTLSDLFFLMTVLVFTYLAGLMVPARHQDASSEEAKMPRCLSGHRLHRLLSIQWSTRNCVITNATTKKKTVVLIAMSKTRNTYK